MSNLEQEQERVTKLMGECLLELELEETTVYDDEEEVREEDELEIQDLQTDTEEEISDEEAVDITLKNPFYIGKDKITTWQRHVPPENVRMKSEITDLPGPKLPLQNIKNVLDIWRYFFNPDMLNLITKYTNQHIQQSQENYKGECNVRLTDIIEIEGLIGLIYLGGILKCNRRNVEELWSVNGMGVEQFRLVMFRTRFQFLLQHLRFDDLETRNQRKDVDKFAPIRDVFELFATNCRNAYTPFQYVTVDEKLESFRGKCSFKQYIPSKPNCYGIKIFTLADVKTFFTCNLEVYVGHQPEGSPYTLDNSPSAVVQRLCEPIKYSNKNVTADKWFTSIKLIETLRNNFQLTYLGTIRKHKKQLPLEFSKPAKRPIGTSMFAFQKNTALVSYIPKKGKNILLVSSFHNDDRIDEISGKPQMINDYYNTKGGVDIIDGLCGAYDCSRNTHRWPMVIFYALLNIAGINSMVLYFLNNPEVTRFRRREFLRILSFEMVENHLRVRIQQTNLPRTVRMRIKELIGLESGNDLPKATGTRRGRCAYCDRIKNRPTRCSCKKCGIYICGEHSTHVCQDCYAEQMT